MSQKAAACVDVTDRETGCFARDEILAGCMASSLAMLLLSRLTGAARAEWEA